MITITNPTATISCLLPAVLPSARSVAHAAFPPLLSVGGRRHEEKRGRRSFPTHKHTRDTLTSLFCLEISSRRNARTHSSLLYVQSTVRTAAGCPFPSLLRSYFSDNFPPSVSVSARPAFWYLTKASSPKPTLPTGPCARVVFACGFFSNASATDGEMVSLYFSKIRHYSVTREARLLRRTALVTCLTNSRRSPPFRSKKRWACFYECQSYCIHCTVELLYPVLYNNRFCIIAVLFKELL